MDKVLAFPEFLSVFKLLLDFLLEDPRVDPAVPREIEAWRKHRTSYLEVENREGLHGALLWSLNQSYRAPDNLRPNPERQKLGPPVTLNELDVLRDRLRDLGLTDDPDPAWKADN
jgi:hypothetical protein